MVIAIVEFVLSNESLERKGAPLLYLKSFSVPVLNDSDIIHGLEKFSNFKLRGAKCFGQKAFGHRLMPKFFLSETFRS